MKFYIGKIFCFKMKFMIIGRVVKILIWRRNCVFSVDCKVVFFNKLFCLSILLIFERVYNLLIIEFIKVLYRCLYR